jgi:membrane protein
VPPSAPAGRWSILPHDPPRTLGVVHPLSLRLIERTPERLRPGVRLIVRTVDGSMGDRLPGLAAEIAFWVLLSLPALLLAALAAASAAGGVGDGDWQQQFVNRTVEVSRVVLTESTIDRFLRPGLNLLIGDEGGVAIASFAFVATVWTASRAVRVVLTALAIAYDRRGVRKAWVDRALGFAITVGGLLSGLVLMPLLLAGPNFGDQLVIWIGQDPVGLADLWRVVYWPAMVVAVTFAIAALYHLGVPGYTPWRRDLPGAVVATSVWLLGSVGLRLYGTWILDGDSVYGPLAGPIVALLWVWVTGFAVLVGAELNAAIDAEWPLDEQPPTPDDTDDVNETAEADDTVAPTRQVTATRRMLERPD